MRYYSIAIDGPAGAGKSTIAKQVAQRLAFIYVDTGAMYRAMALYFIRLGISAEEEEKINRCVKDADVSIAYGEDGLQQVYLNGENVSGLIRTEEVGQMTSATSRYAAVREKMVSLQRELAKKASVVMDGRDIGTCVLPGADLKVYMTASSKERAKRRFLELTAKGIPCNIEEIERGIIERDERDMNREIAPLRQAEDAVFLDTSEMGIEEVAGSILELFEQRKKTSVSGQNTEGDFRTCGIPEAGTGRRQA